MLVSHVADLTAYWVEFPPPHETMRMLAQGMVGFKPIQKFKPSSNDEILAFAGKVKGG